MIGVVPAAGFGTRLGLAEGSKELVAVRGEPVVEYLLRRLEVGGCDEIRLVTRPEKSDLVAFARSRGLTLVLSSPPHVGASIAAGIAGLASDDLVAIGFPDTIWEPLDGFRCLRAAVDGGADIALGLFRTPDAHRSDVVVLGPDGKLVDILVKPEHPPSDLIYGCYVARAEVLCGIEEVDEPSRFLVAHAGHIVGIPLSTTWIDVGAPEGLFRARGSGRGWAL